MGCQDGWREHGDGNPRTRTLALMGEDATVPRIGGTKGGAEIPEPGHGFKAGAPRRCLTQSRCGVTHL
jgi:hypothetical protein